MNSDSLDTAADTRMTGTMAYATACAALVAIIFLTHWPGYSYAVRGGVIPLYYYFLAIALVVPLVFADPFTTLRFTREPLFWWFVVFVVTGLIWLVFAQDFIEVASQQWRLRVLAFSIFLAVAAIVAQSRLRAVAWVIVACVIVASVFNWFDVLRPHRFVPQGIEGATDGRGAGLYINPNAAGSFIVLGAIAALPMIPTRLRGLLLVTAVFGVAATFSRGAFVLISIALVGAIGLKLIKRAQGILLILTIPLLVTSVSLAYDYLIVASENRSIHRVVQRLNWFQDVEDEDEAVAGRKHGAAQAWQLFLDKPVTGHGPGVASLAVRQEGPHNMYLLLMAEQGLLGLAMYIGLLGILIRRGRRLARDALTQHDRDVGNASALAGAYLAAYGLFSHNVLEEPHTIVLLAYIAAAVFAARTVRDAVSTRIPARRNAVPRASPTA